MASFWSKLWRSANGGQSWKFIALSFEGREHGGAKWRGGLMECEIPCPAIISSVMLVDTGCVGHQRPMAVTQGLRIW